MPVAADLYPVEIEDLEIVVTSNIAGSISYDMLANMFGKERHGLINHANHKFISAQILMHAVADQLKLHEGLQAVW